LPVGEEKEAKNRRRNRDRCPISSTASPLKSEKVKGLPLSYKSSKGSRQINPKEKNGAGDGEKVEGFRTRDK